MWHQATALLAVCQILNSASVQAAATWPSASDEVEDIMMLQSGYRARQFAQVMTPCSNSYAPGFRVAAGFLRTAFHDTAAADVSKGTNGMDASIGYELAGDFATLNSGPSFNATMTYLSAFYNSKASMADLLAAGVYASVRSCGGPLIPVRTGRVDATQALAPGLPDVQDNQTVLAGRFQRMGFSPSEMVQLVACGHSLGGVHRAQNPNPAGNATSSTVQTFDTTDSKFDNNVASEYVSGTTRNPLVVGPKQFASDLRVFTIDNNNTITKMADPSAYNSMCANVLQRMIEIVPGGVTLGDEIEPYDAKPGQLNLNVVENGASLVFSGEMRIRTTAVGKSNIAKVQLVYKDRTGGSSCGKCLIDTVAAGDATGFDNSFTFYGFSAKIPAKESISSFNVLVTTTSGQIQKFDNNGKGFPVQDTVFVQSSSSSISPSGDLTVVTAVRNGQGSAPQMSLSLVPGNAYNTLPKVSVVPVSMTKVCDSDLYTYYSGSYKVPASQVSSGKIDVTSGGQADSFRSINFGSNGTPPQCGSKNSTSTTSSTSISSTTSSSISTTKGYTNATTTTLTSTSSSLSTTPKDSSSTTTTSGDSGTYTPPSWTEWDPPSGPTAPAPGPTSPSTTTIVCPGPTTITHAGQTYTVTASTTLTITATAPANTNVNLPGGPSGGSGNDRASSAVAALSSIYVDQANAPAPSDGTNGGNKDIDGLNLSITITPTAAVLVPATTPTAGGSGVGGWTVSGAGAATATGAGWSSWSGSGSGSASTSAPVAKFTGAASRVSFGGAVGLSGLAALLAFF